MKSPIRKLIKQAYARVPLKQPVLEAVRRTIRLPKSLTGSLSFRGAFTVDIDSFHRFKLEHWGYMVESDLFWNGFGNGYEASSLRVWRKLVPHAQVILDVGANTGIYTLAACCINPAATVVALEPVERVFRRLRRNIELNAYNVILEKVAASDINGSATLYDLASDHEYTASLDEMMPQGCNRVVESTVQTKRLDDLLSSAGLRSIDLVKIDVEQFEPQVLLGMGSYLSKCKPTVLIEILNEQIATKVTNITRDLGYNVFQILEDHGLIPRSHLHATDVNERNYLFAQDEIVELANIRDFIIA